MASNSPAPSPGDPPPVIRLGPPFESEETVDDGDVSWSLNTSQVSTEERVADWRFVYLRHDFNATSQMRR